jgi:NIMA (never in mitosis gene a)-related kinase
MLQTIRLPKSFHYLTERLPKANYSPIKLRKVEKQKFMSMLGNDKEEEL